MKKQLEQIGSMNETSKSILSYLFSRKRFRDTSNIVTYKVKLIQAGYKVNPDDYRQFWTQLEKNGFGTLKGKIFKWAHNFRKLEEPKVAINKVSNLSAAERLLFIPTLSGNHHFEVKLPNEQLTESEINNITRALRTIQRKDLL